MQRFRIIVPLCVVFLLAGCSDVVESNHSTISAAKQDIERGWIPMNLPASTVQLRESHDLDTNTGHGTFSFGASDAEQFRRSLTALPDNAVIDRVKIPRARMEQDGYSFYRDNNFYIAIDWSRQRGEFWLVYSPRDAR